MKVMKAFLPSLVGLATCFIAQAEAVACSAVLRPIQTIIEESDVIVRARLVSAQPGNTPALGRVTLEVLEVLKGTFEQRRLTVAGRLTDAPPSPQRRRPPYNQRAGESRLHGGRCFAHDYHNGAQYLLLLKGGTPYWAPLSPTNEEISGPDDPWVLWVKRQLAGLRGH